LATFAKGDVRLCLLQQPDPKVIAHINSSAMAPLCVELEAAIGGDYTVQIKKEQLKGSQAAPEQSPEWPAHASPA
jgi:hypothetical protein